MKQPVILRWMKTAKALFADRLNQVCDEMGIPPEGKNRQGKLAAEFKVSQAAARKWLKGEAWPTMDNLVLISKWAQIRLEWLIWGYGDRHLPSGQVAPEDIAYVTKAMEKLPKHKQSQIKRLAQVIMEEPETT